jgi:hemerythrin
MNTNIGWDSRLSVGSDVIDNQHKVLFDLIKDLNNAITLKATVRVVDVLLGVLRDYTFQHFQVEEDYFRDHAHYSQHCLEHYELIKKLNGFILDYRNNRIDAKAASQFLFPWFIGHIEAFDKPFLSHEVAIVRIQDEPMEIDQFESLEIERTDELPAERKRDGVERRRYKRLLPKEVVDGEIHIDFYNATKLSSGKAKVLNMSPGGLLLNSATAHQIDDLLVLNGSIGRTFRMKEKVVVKSSNGNQYGVKFVAPTAGTIDFFTKLYGSVHLNRARSEQRGD